MIQETDNSSTGQKAQLSYALKPISFFKSSPENARTHSTDQIAKIAASIKEFGFLNPIIAMSDGRVIAGHGRLEAAKKLELKNVPYIDASHLSEAQRRAYMLADNRIALDAGWNEELLAKELRELMDGDKTLVRLTAFDDEEILKRLLSEPDDQSDSATKKFTVTVTCPKCEHEFSLKKKSGN